jgi:hypothetical protein
MEPAATGLPHYRAIVALDIERTLRTIAISLLHLAGITRINRTLQAISRNPGRVLDLIPL